MKNFNRDELIGVDEKSAVELWPRNSSNLNIYAARHEVGAGMVMTVDGGGGDDGKQKQKFLH